MASKNEVGPGDLASIRSELAMMNGKLEHIMAQKTALQRSGLGGFGISEQLMENIDVDLEKRMVDPCDCRPSCKELFTDILQRSAGLVGEPIVEEKKIMELRKELDLAKSKAPYQKCSICFDEVSHAFNGHVRMIRSQSSFMTEKNLNTLISRMDETRMVQDLVDPVSNPQRLEIMKVLLNEPQTYSILSNTTGLRGGNLLFHLHKLSAAGMIAQNVERGDYLLTEKGNKVLKHLMMMALELGEETWI